MTILESIPRALAILLVAAQLACGAPGSEPAPAEGPGSDSPSASLQGTPGGRLVAALRAEPGTLNPVLAADRPAQTLRYLTHSDLIHINRETQLTEPALAESWSVSEDGTLYTLRLRRGVFFSDGEPFDADDVVFTFEVYLDPEVASPNRSLLIVHGEPVRLEKIDAHTVTLRLAGPYAAGERLFDSIAMLPEHLLAAPYAGGTLSDEWKISTPSDRFAGLGPFQPSVYRSGESLTLKRNPHYWRRDSQGRQLPYLDELVLRFAPSEDAEAIRFQSGEIDILSDISAGNFVALAASATSAELSLRDLGPGLAYNFLFFNLNELAGDDLPAVAARQEWFRQLEFRRAVSEVVDRDAITRLVYQGLARPLGGPVPEGNRLWRNTALEAPARSVESARARLRAAGFTLGADGTLRDPRGAPVRFSIVTNSSNRQRVEIAAIVQEDLRALGIEVQVVPIGFQSLVQRLLETHDYDACILGLGGGDVDPNSESTVWLSSGSRHLWAPAQESPVTSWEATVDELMTRQLTEIDAAARKRQYDQVQQILAEQLPLVYLVSPNVLAGAHRDLGNFRPTILEPSALWNVHELFWTPSRKKP